MPAPYPLLDMPPGEFTNIFDYQAINMAAAHNMFIQGINAMVAHAPYVTEEKVQPFMVFCLTLLEGVHHHHHLEETFYFPIMEKKLGAGTLSGNVEEHTHFVPKVEEMEQWLKDVQEGREKYDAQLFLEKVNSFSDTMIDHLNHELPTLESSKIRAVFTEKELKDIDKEFMKLALSNISFYTSLPLSSVCQNPATPWFPPIPLPLKWATKWWFSRKHSEAWEFGPVDFNCKPRQLPGPSA
ncbi:hypothetical protein GALMADRAFT_257009 [Galerina marginata CBS 339.88]|uniref:Hemerythrin-like domain-containing protein n=1 Tax=Galerina marginata (strain CBS 339.88) TaxID=685588 RepID=A0A067SBS2_GALM3|nr:hypothetical protein GALMADRAFT_257009 [Galerina marginata CBS 339.88]